MESIKYVTYYRVSTQKQIESGLGLEAQKKAVAEFTKNCTDCIIAEFTERENSSGKNDKRIELNKAIEKAKSEKAILLIAKLDRLSRKVSFVSSLRDSKVKFVCCDNPNATTLTIDILAAVAEDEARRIAERTKAALDAKKVRLKELGLPENWRTGKWTDEARAKGMKTRKENALTNPNTKKAKNYATVLRGQGKTLQQIADILNDEGHQTASNKKFNKALVKYLIEK